MKIYYVWDSETKIYAGTIQCNEKEKPKDCTESKPLPYKERNEIKWNGKSWEYQPMN